ncbi:MAG: ADP-ribosylglycohydrolase family protein [Candidatus Sumerlaeota bacterium]|nr:ADP-ribosylglycohydrolase family protein [Candidatus Sumerlaeota bacterium]
MIQTSRNIVAVCVLLCVLPLSAGAKVRRLPLREYADKMKGGWIGQMAGVGWGAPTEFGTSKAIMPEDKLPAWKPDMVNQFRQDDVYVEMTFLRTLERDGLDVSSRRAGIDFANSSYGLWHANRYGRDNLRSGIAPPDSGHPKFTRHSDDIDYQIEADFAGLISPGLSNQVIELGNKFGRIMNYGDGVYGGVFIGGMIAGAFFEKDPGKIVEAGLKCIPARSQYAEMARDVLRWHRENPEDWRKTWEHVEAKYARDPNYNRYACHHGSDIDVKINGAYVIMGLLYGKGDPDRTITIAIRCGRDSDCNPSNAAGVLFTSMGFSALPSRFASALDTKTTFAFTAYNFESLVSVCEKLACQSVRRAGGWIEKDASGEKILVIPVSKPEPGRAERSWAPGPAARSRYSARERARICCPPFASEISNALKSIAPGWELTRYHFDQFAELKDWEGRKAFRTYPADSVTSAIWRRQVRFARHTRPSLRLVVSRNMSGGWPLSIKANGGALLVTNIDNSTCPTGWKEITIALDRFAGKNTMLEIAQGPGSTGKDEAYWAEIVLINK